MDDKITIVTAFFPLGREKWKNFERTNNDYFEYFDFWARIQNDMIIYTDKENAKYIEEIRMTKYNRKNTKIIIINEWRKIDEALYNSIKLATENELNRQLRINPNAPEAWNYDYNYITVLKCWFVKDAVEKGLAKGTMAWVDFGYNHGGSYYLESSEFDFEWKWKFSDKIHLFKIRELDELPIFEIIRRLNNYIQAGVIVAPDRFWGELWELVKQNMMNLNKIGIADDEQTILLMVYRDKKELFELHDSTWFSPIRDCSNHKFTIKEEKRKKEKSEMKMGEKMLIKYIWKWFNILKNVELKW